MTRSLCSIVGLLVGCAGIGLFIAIGTYVWTLKSEVDRQAATLTERANGIGDQADKAIAFVREIIDQAKYDLKKVPQPAATQPARPVSMMDQILARKASQELAGSVERAHGAVVTASDAVTVAEMALKVFSGNSELQQLFRVQTDQMNATKSTLGKVAGELREVKIVLGVPVGNDGRLTTEQLNAVSNALGQAQGFTDELEKVVTTARGRVNETKSSVDRWSWRIAVATSLISALGTLGQFFLARFCWRRLRELPS